MKIKSTLAAAALSGALLLGFVAPSSASEQGISESVGATVASDPMLERLEALVGTQSKAEIDAIRLSDAPAELLFDPASGEYLAAIETEAQMSPFAISPVGPGCTTTSACAWSNGTTPYGYSGTGSLAINVKNVKKISGGAYTTTFWYNSKSGNFVAANKTVSFTTGFNAIKITRS